MPRLRRNCPEKQEIRGKDLPRRDAEDLLQTRYDTSERMAAGSPAANFNLVFHHGARRSWRMTDNHSYSTSVNGFKIRVGTGEAAIQLPSSDGFHLT